LHPPHLQRPVRCRTICVTQRAQCPRSLRPAKARADYDGRCVFRRTTSGLSSAISSCSRGVSRRTAESKMPRGNSALNSVAAKVYGGADTEQNWRKRAARQPTSPAGFHSPDAAERLHRAASRRISAIVHRTRRLSNGSHTSGCMSIGSCWTSCRCEDCNSPADLGLLGLQTLGVLGGVALNSMISSRV
jgi:hypothetical protein